MKLKARGTEFVFPRRPVVMGIVNLCENSFCGDGIANPDLAIERAKSLITEGAEIIDIGAESARTDGAAIGEQEEIDRLCAFLERWTGGALLSINTWRPAVARAVLARGGDLLNDISGLPTAENAEICAAAGVALLIMHTIGAPKVAHTHVGYPDVMAELERFFAEKLALAERAGMSRDAIVIDPGIDFAKQRADNLRIYRELSRLHQFGRPILLPVSRKTVIGETLGIERPAERDAGTVACIVQGMQQGAQIFRVHDVRAAVQTIRTITAIHGSPDT
ncbi:MAG TPA: dihydropteroate synthase [Chthoniobacteraceae bacterium]